MAERAHIAKSLRRPLQIWVRRPIIWFKSLTATFSFDIYTLVLGTCATLWIEEYAQSELFSSLHYISIVIGATLCGQIGGCAIDKICHFMSKRAGGKGAAGYRIPYMVPGMFIMPVGLVWYGWSASHRLHWAMVDVGVIVFTLGNFMVNQATVAYQIEELGQFATSAGAASGSVSYGLAFAFPIFAPGLFEDSGYGWGNSTLAFVAMSLGLPTCAVL